MDNDTPQAEDAPTNAVPSTRVVYCVACGSELDGLAIGEPCPSCGVPVGSMKVAGKSNGTAVTAMVLGICSIVGCLFYGIPGIVCGILALIFAKKSQRGIEAGHYDRSSSGMTNAGRICGIIGLCLSVVYGLVSIGWLVYVFAVMVPQQQQQMQQWQQQQSVPTQPAPAQPPPAPPTSP